MNEKEAKFRAYITYIANGFVGYVSGALRFAEENGFSKEEVIKARDYAFRNEE